MRRLKMEKDAKRFADKVIATQRGGYAKPMLVS